MSVFFGNYHVWWQNLNIIWTVFHPLMSCLHNQTRLIWLAEEVSCPTKPDPWPIKSVGFGCPSNSLAGGKQSLISEDSGYENVLDANPRYISSLIKYAEVPEEEKWRINILQELLLISDNKLQIDQKVSKMD